MKTRNQAKFILIIFEDDVITFPGGAKMRFNYRLVISETVSPFFKERINYSQCFVIIASKYYHTNLKDVINDTHAVKCDDPTLFSQDRKPEKNATRWIPAASLLIRKADTKPANNK